jgi:L-lactate dehydrogenase complex protein LldF
MTTRFRNRIKRSLLDENLQAALDANAERRIAVRKYAFATLKNPEAMRARAHAVRADVIANLDRYLAQFTNQLETHGTLVHRAESAAQAIQIILEIAKRNGVRLVAKSKTMVSEEIELNPALEAAGLRVVETDLGEYIVQIRKEAPSHIITPAVHLRRADVGRTFHEVLGIPYTEDIPTMTAAARQTLREVFLNAEMGISGMNFGVAASGTLCIVTNEGNGRMVTTLPSIHVALMGMERIVPTLDDLALMLALLPRSATGQKLSVYTSLLHTPRRSNDPDGPRERHVILVDNGRSQIRQSPLAEILYCIRCGACLNACPVFREIGGHAYIGVSGKHSSYPGPIGSVVSPALFGQSEFGQLARASSLCGACKEACPVDIDLPRLLLRVRAGQVSNVSKPDTDLKYLPARQINQPNTPAILALGLKFFTWIAVSPKRFALAQKLGGLFGRIGKWVTPGGVMREDRWLHLPAMSGWGRSKDFPAPASKTFHERWKKLDKLPISKSPVMVERLEPGLSNIDGKSPTKARLKVFEEELLLLGATFSLCRDEEVATRVIDLISERRSTQVLAWQASHLPTGLLDTLLQNGIEIFFPTSETIESNSLIKIGLTGAEAGIAETGTILVTSGEGKPLSASLLPDVHIAILREEDLYENLGEVIRLRGLSDAPAAVLISGPSRTADIEMTLTIGVHGPGQLHVICISEN